MPDPPPGGTATIHLCSLQIAELTPIFGFRLKKNWRRSIYLFSPLQTANYPHFVRALSVWAADL